VFLLKKAQDLYDTRVSKRIAQTILSVYNDMLVLPLDDVGCSLILNSVYREALGITPSARSGLAGATKELLVDTYLNGLQRVRILVLKAKQLEISISYGDAASLLAGLEFATSPTHGLPAGPSIDRPALHSDSLIGTAGDIVCSGEPDVRLSRNEDDKPGSRRVREGRR